MDEDLDFDLSEREIKAALERFDVPNHEIDKMVMNVMRLVTSKQFYDNKRVVDNVPEYGFRTSDIVHAYDYEENTRESVRKDALNPLRNYGVLEREQPVPRSPNTYYFLSPEFRSLLENTPMDETVKEPESSDAFDGELDLDYHDSKIKLEPGEHAKLMAESLDYLIPKITDDPELVYGAIDDEKERENVKNGKLHLELLGKELRLEKYPDIIVLDKSDNTLYLIEAVVSLNPFKTSRVDTIKKDLSRGLSEVRLVFISAFPTESEYRKHLMTLADRSYVWLSNHKDIIRGHSRNKIKENTRLEFSHGS